MSWCCCLFLYGIPNIKPPGKPLPSARSGAVIAVQLGAGQDPPWHGVAVATTEVQPVPASHCFRETKMQEKMNTTPMGGRHRLFLTQRKRNLGDSSGDGEANALVCLKRHSCAWLSHSLWTSGPWVWKMLLVCAVPACDRKEWKIGPSNHTSMLKHLFPSSSVTILGIWLQNMDILNYNLPLLSY